MRGGLSFLNRSRNIRIAQVGGTAATAAAATTTSNEGAPYLVVRERVRIHLGAWRRRR